MPLSSLTRHSADNTKASIEKSGRQCLQLPLNLEDTSNAQKAIEKHMTKFGRLDILVNNASKQIMCKSLEEIDVSGANPFVLAFAMEVA
jgi:NADP-dependent 3-hydroxy acid dehydrogenase YdfG